MTSELIGRAGRRTGDPSGALTDDLPGSVDGVETSGTARVTIDGRPFPIRPHHCFACGELNVHGLGLPLHIEGDTCWTELALPDRFEGWEGIGHGGIVCTILDEVMAWSLAARGEWGLTARMTVEFKRPVRIGVPVRAEGRLVRVRRRLMETAAHLVDSSSGELLATADAIYIAAPAAQRAELQRRYGFEPDAAVKAANGAGAAPASGAGVGTAERAP